MNDELNKEKPKTKLLNTPVNYTLMSYSMSLDGIIGLVKSPTILGTFIKEDKSALNMPLAYLKKPKWMSDEDWGKVFHSIQLFISNNNRNFLSNNQP